MIFLLILAQLALLAMTFTGLVSVSLFVLFLPTIAVFLFVMLSLGVAFVAALAAGIIAANSVKK